MQRGAIAIAYCCCLLLAACGTSPRVEADQEYLVTDPVMVAKAVAFMPSSLDSVPNLTLITEMARRGFTEWGCPDNVKVRATWSPPDTGSPVRNYVFQLWALADSISDTTTHFWVPRWWDRGLYHFEAIVAAEDSLDRQGPYSDPSDVLIIPED